MLPVVIAPGLALTGRRRLRRVACEPSPHVEIVILLRPDHAGERLALHQLRILAGDVALQRRVEFIGFGKTRREDGLEIRERGSLGAGLTKSEAKRRRGSRRE